MIRSFRNRATEDVFDGIQSRAARQICPSALWPIAQRKLDLLNRVTEVQQLKVPPGNQLERLRGNRKGQWSIRINKQYRLCFLWEQDDADQVEITDYH